MTFTEERDKAAEKYAETAEYDFSQTTEDIVGNAYKAGADWALKSEVVKKLVQAIENYCNTNMVAKEQAKDSCYDQFNKALEACAQAVKESEK